MAGSYLHITDTEGNLISKNQFIRMIEDQDDAYQMAEECWYIIQILADGDKEKIDKASKFANRAILNHKRLEDENN